MLPFSNPFHGRHYYRNESTKGRHIWETCPGFPFSPSFILVPKAPRCESFHAKLGQKTGVIWNVHVCWYITFTIHWPCQWKTPVLNEKKMVEWCGVETRIRGVSTLCFTCFWRAGTTLYQLEQDEMYRSILTRGWLVRNYMKASYIPQSLSLTFDQRGHQHLSFPGYRSHCHSLHYHLSSWPVPPGF